MTVKASAQITISKVIDIYACYRYYKLQSSTLVKPAKPTTNPPSGWSDTEPAYVSGSTNTLYFVDCNVYSDMTFSFSEVSKSTSYEAAKDAWNKANNAQDTADSKPDMSDVEDYVVSRGENLVTNGTCLLGDNTNFSSFTYDGSDTYYAGGSFKIGSTSTSGNIVVCDEFIPVDAASKYLFSYWIKTSNASARYHDFIASYDIDKKSIYAAHVMWIAGSTTTLAKELKNGDTVIYLTSAAGFNTTTTNDYQKGLIFWNYKNSKGYTYGPETYSQNRWESLWGDGSAIDKSNNTITLKTAWTHGTFPAGTSVSQCSDGGSYIYLNGDFTLSAANTWFHKTGTVCGVGKNDASGKFREGTAFVKVGWITNRDVSSGATCWLSTISLTQNVGLADVIKSVDVEYYLSTSATSLSGGSWSTTAPTWVDGKYMWSRTVTVNGTDSKTYSPNQNGVCIAGAKGSTGAAGKGVTSIVEEYYKSTSATSLTGGSWKTTYPGWENGTYIWTRSVITYTDSTTTTTAAVCVTGTKGDTGAKGDKGDTGATGNGISKIDEHYAVSSSNSTAPTSWSSTVPTMTTTNKYLWNYETITYTNGLTADTTKRVIGVYGNTGSKGDTGATGKGISKVTEHYAVSTSNSTAPTSWSETVPTLTATNKYLWNYETITYTDNTTSDTAKRVIGVYGDKGQTGVTGKGVKSSAVTYQASTSGTTIPTGTWSSTIPSVAAGSYLWTKTVITYTDSATTTSYSVGKMGSNGSKGDTGATGKGVKSTAVTYQASTSGTTVPTGTWSSTIPSVSAGSFLWTRTIITYTDDTTSTSYSIGKMGNTGATGAMGETLSNGKLLYKDVMFAEGNNGISSYNNSSGGAVTLVRQAKSSDNPCGDYELAITNTGAASPGIGGFKWAHATRANAVFIYRIIAKIPTDRALRWMSNSAGDVTSGKFLTSNSGTGKFTEYIYKFTCGASGTFGTTGFFYINGSAGSSSSPVKWYVAYAGVWDMTDYEDMLPKDEAKDIYTTQLEMSKTNSELRMDFNKSIVSATDDIQSKLDAANNATNQKFGEISKYIRFVDGKIVLGETGSELTLTVQNDRVSFQQAGNEVAYFSNNNLYIRRAEVLTTLKVGNYEFAPRNDGGLALRKRGN